MPPSKSYTSYTMEYEIMDTALASERGIRATIGADYGTAHNFRYRLNAARIVDRRRISESLTPGSPGYMTSPYDELIFSLTQDDQGLWCVDFKKNRQPMKISDLAEIESKQIERAKTQISLDEVIKPIISEPTQKFIRRF